MSFAFQNFFKPTLNTVFRKINIHLEFTERTHNIKSGISYLKSDSNVVLKVFDKKSDSDLVRQN